MEERLVDKDEFRKIKIKRNQVGGIDDATEEGVGADGEEEEYDEIVVEMPQEEPSEEGEYDETDDYDEDSVGLSAKQLRQLQEKRERERKQAEELCAQAYVFLDKGEFEDAVTFFSQALVLDTQNESAQKGLWLARTKNFTDDEPFFDESISLEVSQAPDEIKAYIRENVGERLAAERARVEELAAPIRKRLTEAQEERREAFSENRKYYILRSLLSFAVLAVMLIGGIVSASFLTRTQSIAPIVCLGVFGVLALAALVVFLCFAKKLLEADRLCHKNDDLYSTEEGMELEELEETLLSLKEVLDD